ncbi:response regulator transcription factor [Anoxynatronum sibiricum]|uniref:Stage 0 sporulation protein A homolog n=1 Tax=Anoxynatronum sibiricum TaxID=210623 RepID=A0ABU9VTV7_9CLOT
MTTDNVKQPIGLMIVDDHSIVREGLRFLIELNDDFQVTGEAENLPQALERLSENLPDIIILDYQLAQGDGVLACQEIKRRYPALKVLILTAFAKPHVVLEAVKAGADGFLVKSVDHDSLMRALYDLHEGKSVLDAVVTDYVLDRIRVKPSKAESMLTEREEKMINLISQGHTNYEIASVLDISEKSVRNGISTIFKKLNVSNRTEAAAYWLKHQYQDSFPAGESKPGGEIK